MTQPMDKPHPSPPDSPQTRGERLTLTYLLWLPGVVGIGGIHRLYNGKVLTGLLWLCTGGLFGIGQFVDLFLIPDMSESKRMRLLRARGGVPPSSAATARPVATQTVQPQTREQLMVQILQAARSRQGRLTVPQAVMETQLSFETVEDLLNEMHRKGYAAIDNDLDTGIIIYEFVGL